MTLNTHKQSILNVLTQLENELNESSTSSNSYNTR